MNYISATTPRVLVAVLSLIVWSSGSLASDQDEMRKRLLACAGCHEYQYEEQPAYAPSIAGKPAEYLYQQLLNYREGRRLNNSMQQMLAYLSDDYLHEIASYFAKLPEDDFRPELSSTDQPSAQTALGKMLVQKGSKGVGCIDCHGNDLRGDGVAIPSLRNLSASYIVAQLGAWQTNTRHARAPDCMKEVAKDLTGAEVNAVAHWIAKSFEEATAPPLPKSTMPLPCGALQ